MAKKNGRGALYCAIAAALLLCALAFGCKEKSGDDDPSGNGGNGLKLTHELGTFPGLDAETERRILQDYFDAYVKPEDPDATVNNIWIEGYYGTYNGVVAVRVGDFLGYADVLTGESVAGINFTYPNPKPNYAWKDGSLYRLHEAYNLGLLTDDDVKNIHGMYYEDWMGGNNHD